MAAVCPVCTSAIASIQKLELHLKLNHEVFVFQGSQVYECKDSCFRQFANWKTYRQHLIRTHKVPISVLDSPKAAKRNISSESSAPPSKIFKSDGNISTGSNLHKSMEPLVCSIDTPDFVNDSINLDKTSFNVLSEKIELSSKELFKSLYSNKSVNRSYIQTVISEVSEFIANSVSCVRNVIQSELSKSGASPFSQDYVNKCLNIIERPFIKNSTDYRRLQNFKKMSTWVEPEELVIGDAEDLNASSVVPVQVKMTHIPLSKSLKAFLETPGIFKSICDYIDFLNSQPKDVVSNFVQTDFWKAKINNRPGMHLPLFKYYDDFQVNNSLGPHCDSGKLGGVYCSIPVLPPKFQSLVENIFVVLLFKSHDRDSFSNSPIFHKVIEELKDLQENGIEIFVDGVTHLVYFHLGLVVGDNLGVNSMFDFVACFTANHCCRFCKIHRDALHFANVEDPSLLRTVDNYSADVVTDDPSLTGVVRDSVWNTLPNFHVTKNPSVDIMHDLLQGVCHYDMGHIISYLIKKNYFTLDDLNFHLGSHNYGCLAGENKPSSIRSEHLKECHFKMSASEMLTFVRNFSVMVGHLVPKGDRVWSFYLLLRQILDIVLSPVTTPYMCDSLDSLVAEHNDLYVVLFNDVLKPKHHNLVHYGRIMRMVGPLAHIWCMRFESKNREHAIVAHATQSRKNICKTLAIREQISQVTKNVEVCPDVEFGPFDYCDVSMNDFLSFLPLLPFQGKFMNARYVRYKGVEFRIGSYVYVESKDELPLFGKIMYIIVNGEEKLTFCVHKFETKYFSDHFHAFSINDSAYVPQCVHPRDLVQHQVFTHNFNGASYVSARYLV